MKLAVEYDRMIQKLLNAIYVCDANGYVKLFNKAAADLWGREPEVDKDLYCGSWKIMDAEGNELPIEKHPLAVALKENKLPEAVEMIIKRPDGSYRYVQHSSMPIYNRDGVFSGMINMLIEKKTENRDQ